MALIGEIRKRSWILIVLIGLAMGGFLLMDMFSRMGVGGLMNPNQMGSVSGEKIDAQAFFAREQALFQSSENSFGNKDALWNLYVRVVWRNSSCVWYGTVRVWWIPRPVWKACPPRVVPPRHRCLSAPSQPRGLVFGETPFRVDPSLLSSRGSPLRLSCGQTRSLQGQRYCRSSA